MENTKEYLAMEAEDMKGTFYGWDMKCQSDSQTLAVITDHLFRATWNIICFETDKASFEYEYP